LSFTSKHLYGINEIVYGFNVMAVDIFLRRGAGLVDDDQPGSEVGSKALVDFASSRARGP
jgi:hypothetical protein